MLPVVSAVELIYRDICKPRPQTPKPEPQPKEHTELTQEDVAKILAAERSATPEQLQYIIDHVHEFDLSTYQRDKIALQMTIAIAAKLRQARGVREDPTSELLRSMGILETPFGLLYGAERFAAELKSGTKAIMDCRTHRPPLCRCWLASRDWLYCIRQGFDQRSPEAYAAIKVWHALGDIEALERTKGAAR